MGDHEVLLRMVSRVERREDFLDAFHPFVDERSVLVISKSVPAVGTQIMFSIELKDGLPVLRGEGVVDDPPVVIEPGRPVKVRLRIVKWTHDSEATFRQLLEYKRRATVRRAARASVPPPTRPPPPPPPKPEAVPSAVSAEEEVTGAVAPLAPPLPEQRTPGASYQLPANPFSEIPDHILEDFIECVLHPDVAQRPPGADPEPPRGDPHASDSIPSFRGGSPVVAAAAAPAPIQAAPAVVVAPPPAVVVRSGLAPLLFTALLAGGAAAAGMYIYLTRYHGEPVAAQPEPRPAPALTPAAPVASAVAAHPAEPIARPPSPPVVVVPPPAAPPPAEPPPASEPPPAVASEPPIPTDPDACIVSVRSHEEARVFVGERMVGNPPLQTELMCDAPVIVAIVHPRYLRYERKVTAKPGQPVILDVQLSRETLALAVNTTPSGATIAVNGRVIGKSPARTEVKAYSSVLVTASLDGYKLWSRRMQLHEPDTVSTKLDPIPGLP